MLAHNSPCIADYLPFTSESPYIFLYGCMACSVFPVVGRSEPWIDLQELCHPEEVYLAAAGMTKDRQVMPAAMAPGSPSLRALRAGRARRTGTPLPSSLQSPPPPLHPPQEPYPRQQQQQPLRRSSALRQVAVAPWALSASCLGSVSSQRCVKTVLQRPTDVMQDLLDHP